MSDFITPALIGGRRVRMVGQQIYEEVITAYDWPGVGGLALVGMLVASSIRRAMRMLHDDWVSIFSQAGSPETTARPSIAGWRRASA